MNSAKLMAACVLTALLAGCASAVPVIDFYDADSGTLSRFQRITVISDSQGLKNLGDVQGIYCSKTYGHVEADDPLAETQAVDQVKLKAAEKGADHIGVPQCEVQDSGDFTNNCYGTVVCTATVLKLTGL